MNISELQSYSLDDAVKFNDQLNPALWGKDDHLLPEVKRKLMAIADDFREFLGITELDIKDITVSGSNAAYTYTPNSDIDLHLVVDLPRADHDDVYRELFDAKKYQYNDQHDFRIGGYDVELYVQNANQPHVSQGIYSLKHNDWVKVPSRRKPEIDDISVKSKYEDIGNRIDQAIDSQDLDRMDAMARKIREMRQAGLQQTGEFGPENLAFKVLRNNGTLERLRNARLEAKNRLMSLNERRKKKSRGKKFRYGAFGGYYYPGYHYYGDTGAAADGGGDGGGGGESVRESQEESQQQTIERFVKSCCEFLGIEQCPRVRLRRDPQWSARNGTFGRFDPETNSVELAVGGRHIVDILRTLAHEMTHARQEEIEALPDDAGETGSRYEDQANAMAGRIMRHWAEQDPKIFQGVDLDEDLKSKLGAMAAAACIAGTPGCSTTQGTTVKDTVKAVQTVGKTAQNLKRMGLPGAREELEQRVKDELRRQRGEVVPENKLKEASGYIPTDKEKNDPRFSMALTQDIRPGQTGKEANKLKLRTDSQGRPQVARPNGLFEELMLEYQLSKEAIQTPVNKARDAKQYYDFIKGKQKLGRPLTRAEQDYLKIYQMYHQQKLAEISSSASGEIEEDEDLEEVKMSPTALEKFATSDAAKGIRAGFEAELIFRDTQGESDEMDPEPNYDADERAYSIQQVIEFFQQDEYGYGMNDRQTRRLENDLDEKYMYWYDEQVDNAFNEEAEDLVREKLLDDRPYSERILAYLTDGDGNDSMDLTDEQADRIMAIGEKAPKFTKLADQEAYTEANPDYRIYLEAADAVDALLDEEVEESISRRDEYYDSAREDFRDSYNPDSDSFFSDVGLRWMSDIANEFNLDWPVWNMDAGRNDGSRSWEDIGDSLHEAVGMPVKVSSNYHSATRREGMWIVEPDGSLSPDDPSEEAGLEIVSPPMPLLTAIEKLRAVTDWANDPNGGNAYTNSSTGLHMGVSLPRIQAEDANDAAGIDYVKLILFMGDKYVLQQFGRSANTYTASALDKLKQNIKGGRSDPAGVVKLLQHGLTELAHKELQKGVGTSKYTSAHLQDGYVEFRSPGGDWLAKSDEEIGILENTMLRFARAMAIAGDPNAERQEYAKKLYKLVTQDNEQYADQLRLFSEFSAGTINKEQLKKQWADSVLQKEIPGAGKEEYEVYRRDRKDSPDAIVGTLYAKDYDSAYDQFLRQYGKDINDLDVRLKQPWFDVFDAEGKILMTMRASDIDKAQQRVEYEYGERSKAWRVYRRPDNTPEPKVSPRAQVAKRIVKKPQGPTQFNYEVVDRRTGKVVDKFYAERESTADAVYNRWLEIKNLPNDTEDYGYRKSAQAADDQRDSVDIQRRLGVSDVDTDVAQNFGPRRQNWEFVTDDDPDRVVHRMNDATTDEVMAWLRQQEQQGMPPGLLRTRIVAETIDPVSGAGAVPPRPVVKKIDTTKKVQPVEPVIKRQAYRSAIGQAISQRDLENMTQQIQVARRLGDDINETNVFAMPDNLGAARRIAQEWIDEFNKADSANRNQILAGLQRQLADLGWKITSTREQGGVLKHLGTGRLIPLTKIAANEAQSTGTPTRARAITAPRVSTLDRSAPWVRAALGRSQARKRRFEDLPTDKEKFDFLYNLKQGKTTNQIVIPGTGKNNYQIQSYDPATGDIVVTFHAGSARNTYRGNTKDFVFRGSQKPGAGSARNYIFSPRSLEMIDSQPTRAGAPSGPRKKQYTFPKMPW